MDSWPTQPPPYESVPPAPVPVEIRRKPVTRKPLPSASSVKAPANDQSLLETTNTKAAPGATLIDKTAPVGSQSLTDTTNTKDAGLASLCENLAATHLGQNVPTQQRGHQHEHPPLAVDTGAVPSGLPLELVQSPLETVSSATTQATPTPTSATSTSSSKWKSMYEEARHFAGGLMSRPVESTKHYSVMRHSYGIVYYQGAATSIAITIFSDWPLPAERSLWLQCRGWSGKTGLRIGTLVKGAGNWIDVTPSSQVTTDQLVPTDERAWQRDISKFAKKAKKGPVAGHVVRETDIIRIPAETQDGYFRVVLCGPKKKILCPSPIFRVSSMSSSPGTLRGASLSTLPLEIGGKIVSTLVSSGMHNAAQPIKATASQYGAGAATRLAVEEAATTAYDASGMHEAYQQARQAEGAAAYEGSCATAIPDTLQAPYPITWTSRITPSEMHQDGLDISRVDIDLVPDKILYRLCGHYFGWARVQSSKQVPISEEASIWCQAIISIVPYVGNRASVKAGVRRRSFVHLIHDLDADEASFTGANIDIRVMGFLRRPDPFVFPSSSSSPSSSTAAAAAAAAALPALATETTQTRQQEQDDSAAEETAAMALLDDIAATVNALAQPGWGAQDSSSPSCSSSSPTDPATTQKMGIKEHYVAARQVTQDRIDHLNLHRYGLRTQKDVLMDRIVGTGGYYVLR